MPSWRNSTRFPSPSRPIAGPGSKPLPGPTMHGRSRPGRPACAAGHDGGGGRSRSRRKGTKEGRPSKKAWSALLHRLAGPSGCAASRAGRHGLWLQPFRRAPFRVRPAPPARPVFLRPAAFLKWLTWQDKNPRFFYGSWRLPGAVAFSLTTPPLPNRRGGSRYSNRHGREAGAFHVSHSRPAIQTPGATPHQASFPSSPEPCDGAWPRIPCLSAEGGLP